jgi:hypothetical protein
MANSSIDASSGDSQGSSMVYQTFLRQWGHIHLHYPSGNPHDDQAVYVDMGADAGGYLKYSGYR